MSSIEEEIEKGPVNPERRPRTLALTLVVLGVLALIAAGVGVGATVLGQFRRNENILPRQLEIYAVYPNADLRYLRVVRPSDEQLLDDDVAFEPEVRTISGPPYTDPAAVTQEETWGGRLTETRTGQPRLDGTQVTEYDLFRDFTDGQVFGVDVTLSSSPQLEASGDVFELTVVVRPQQVFTQRMIAVAVPRQAEVEAAEGPQNYRDTVIGGWRVYYFDATTIETEQTIRMRFVPPSSDARPDVDYLQFELNR